MRVVALLTVRNEELYLARCLEHLIANGVDVCVIDNGSTDSTRQIAEQHLGRGVIRLESVPYEGAFALLPILKNEERLAGDIEADWFVHHDADEIRESPVAGVTLAQGVETVDAEGYNAINFDEFVFVPRSEHEHFEGRDYVQDMRWYYYFSPKGQQHRLNAWKRTRVPVDLCGSGGHKVEFPGRRVYPTGFVMRHYIALSWEHMARKYLSRQYASEEITERKWHGARARFDPSLVQKFDWSRMKRVERRGEWDRSDPWPAHPMFPRGTPRAVER